jgi:hypothetical protein
MEREIVELRKQIAEQTTPTKSNGMSMQSASQSAIYMSEDQYGSNDGFERRCEYAEEDRRRFGDPRLHIRFVQHASFPALHWLGLKADLIASFFTQYHPFLPFLTSEMAPEDFFEYCPALFWAIASVGARRYPADASLLNRLTGPITRLLCTWPFPTSSTSSDPTFMFCGVMMQISTQIGLHRPSYAQDFSKFRMELQEDELKDRVRTWAIGNIVAQR